MGSSPHVRTRKEKTQVIAPALEAPDSKGDRRTKGDRRNATQQISNSIYPWLMSLPIFIPLLIALIAATITKHQSGTMVEPIRYAGSWQFCAPWVGCLPIVLLSWFVSSLCDGAFNGTQPPFEYICDLTLSYIWMNSMKLERSVAFASAI